MSGFAHVLRDGLALAFLRAPRRVPLGAGFGSFAILFTVGVALDLAWGWVIAGDHRQFNPFGLQTVLASAFLRLAAVAVLVAGSGRRALFWPAAAWLEAALLVVTVIIAPLLMLDGQVPFPLGFWAWFANLAWVLLILLRLGVFLARPARVRGIAAALLAFLIHFGPWTLLENENLWVQAEPEEEFVEAPPAGLLAEPEQAMYAQPALLDAAVRALAAPRRDQPDLYAVLFGGDAGEDVFRNEVDYAQRLLEQRLDARGRVLALLNHPATAATRPLATATNLERALLALARRVDVQDDILLLYLTSHGTPDHQLYVNQPPLPLDQLTPLRLRAALDAAGFRWRVLVVSACYSGGFIDALRDERTLVITASRADRSSFGCGAESDITWFGDALLAHGLNTSTDFVEAFARARRLIAKWEREEDYPASEPQIDEGAQIGAKLAAWRAGLRPGPPLRFEPPAP